MIIYLDKVSNTLSFLVRKTTIVLIAAILIVATLQVAMRYFFNFSLQWSEEFCRYCLVWSAFLSMSAAFKSGMHLKIDVLEKKLSNKNSLSVLSVIAIVDLTTVVFIALVIYFGLKMAMLNFNQMSLSMNLPMIVPYASIPTGFTIMLVYHLENVMKTWREVFNNLWSPNQTNPTGEITEIGDKI